jgi:D-amino-acid oxidase
MNRRDFLGGSALAAAGIREKDKKPLSAASSPVLPPETLPKLMPVRATTDRIFRTTVCLRPFRAAGPRLDAEKVGDKLVFHNYGHGGSGWSLSWGSGSIVTEKALGTGERDMAVLGCGALGLTAATLLQRAGARVTIYAKERPPEVRSSGATGSWTPDSRIAMAASVSADFPALWERMCRKSFSIYQSYLGMPGNPVEWTDRYNLAELNYADMEAARKKADTDGFAHYQDRVADLTPHPQEFGPGLHPFPTKYARRNSSMMFNIAAYSRQLVSDFLTEGGRIERLELHSPSELSALPQKVVINCTGYGARALWKDESIVPVRGQIAWLIPQPEVNYGLQYKNIYVLGRRDGIVVQDVGESEMSGVGDDNEIADRKEAENAVQIVADLFRRMNTGA